MAVMSPGEGQTLTQMMRRSGSAVTTPSVHIITNCTAWSVENIFHSPLSYLAAFFFFFTGFFHGSGARTGAGTGFWSSLSPSNCSRVLAAFLAKLPFGLDGTALAADAIAYRACINWRLRQSWHGGASAGRDIDRRLSFAMTVSPPALPQNWPSSAVFQSVAGTTTPDLRLSSALPRAPLELLRSPLPGDIAKPVRAFRDKPSPWLITGIACYGHQYSPR